MGFKKNVASPKCWVLAVITVCLLTAIPFLSAAQSVKPERKFSDKTSKKMPIVIEAVNNLQKFNEDWLRGLEIVVKNVSDKPIYFIDVMIEFPNIAAPPPMPRADGTTPSETSVGFSLTYGRLRLGDIKNVATLEDEPIKPGETYTFKIPDTRVQGFQRMKREMRLRENAADLIEIHINTISFGDGTGYIGGKKIVFPVKRLVNVPHKCSTRAQTWACGAKMVRISERIVIASQSLRLWWTSTATVSTYRMGETG